MYQVPDGTPMSEPIFAAAGDQECVIWIDPLFWAKVGRPTQCALIFHEYGHMLGLKHTEGPSASDPLWMMAELLPASAAPPACQYFVIYPDPGDRQTRSSRFKADRKWCRRNENACYARYSALANDVLTEEAFQRAFDAYYEL